MKVVLLRSWGAEVQYMRHWLRTSQLRQAETRDAIRRHSRNLLRHSDLRRDRRAVTETQAPPLPWSPDHFFTLQGSFPS